MTREPDAAISLSASRQPDVTPTRPKGRDTRTEILAVASELFTEQGFEATSLREIAVRLGITKAALYYHFASKDDILRAIMEPIGEILGELPVRLEAARTTTEWADALTWLVEMISGHTDFFRLLERNRHSVEQLEETFNELGDRLQLHKRIEAAVHSTAADLHEEIRMFAALGAVTAFDDWAPQLLSEAALDVVQRELSAAVRAILGLPKQDELHRRADDESIVTAGEENQA
jgi:AcrR family transcriptional regulator